MADIGGINGIDILNIAAYNGTLRTNIAKFQGFENRIEGDFYTGSLINRYSPFGYTSGLLLDSASINDITIDGATHVGIGAQHFSFDGVNDSAVSEIETITNLAIRSNEFDQSPWRFSNTVAANEWSWTGSQAGYDGTEDAWVANKPNTVNQYFKQDCVVVGNEYTFSAYCKAGDLSIVNFFFGTPVIRWDLTTGNTYSWVRSVSNYGSVDMGNGWWYLYFTFTASSTAIQFQVRDANNQLATGSAYFQDIQVTAGATLKSYVDRGANQLLQSNNFDISPWSLVNLAATEGQSGYDGSTDAWKIQSTTSATSARLQQDVTISGKYVYSVYAKAGNTGALGLRSNNSSTITWFDLDNGTKYSGLSSGTITPVGNDWYRVSIQHQSCTSVRFYISDTPGAYSVSDAKYIYLQDAQLEDGETLTTYDDVRTAGTTTPELPEDGNFSMGVWVRWDELSGFQIPFGKYNENLEGALFYVNSNQLYYRGETFDSAIDSQLIMTVSENEWYYVCSSHDEDGNVSVWVGDSDGFNKKVDNVSTEIILPFITADVRYGDATYYHKGDLSNAHFYNENVSEVNWEANWVNQKALYGY